MAVKRESIDVSAGLVNQRMVVSDIHRNPSGDWIATVEIQVEARTEDGRTIQMNGERTVKGWQRGRRAKVVRRATT